MASPCRRRSSPVLPTTTRSPGSWTRSSPRRNLAAPTPPASATSMASPRSGPGAAPQDSRPAVREGGQGWVDGGAGSTGAASPGPAWSGPPPPPIDPGVPVLSVGDVVGGGGSVVVVGAVVVGVTEVDGSVELVGGDVAGDVGKEVGPTPEPPPGSAGLVGVEVGVAPLGAATGGSFGGTAVDWSTASWM